MRADDIRRMESFDNWCLSILSKMKSIDRISIEKVLKQCFEIMSLSDTIRKRRPRCFGNVVRRDNSRLITKVLDPTPYEGWKRRHRGQLKTWLDTIKSDVDWFGLDKLHGLRKWRVGWVGICCDLVSDRKAWAVAIRDIRGADLSCQG